MKEIQLSKGFVALVDDSDYEFLSKWKWFVSGNETYALRWKRTGDGGCTVPMHRDIAQPGPGLFVDHIDGNGLNNQRNNLRVVTAQENSSNRRVHRNNSSGRPGVDYVKARRRWRVLIGVRGKRIFLGYFDSFEEAVRAREEAERKYGFTTRMI